MTHITRTIVLILLLAGAPTSAQQPPATQPARPSPLILAKRVEASATALGSPAAAEWAKVDGVEVPLEAAFSVTPGMAFETRTKAVRVKALHNGADVFIRLAWKDEKVDASVADTRFADAAAIQLPLTKGGLPEYAMGFPNAHVNIWYWRPDLERPRNIVAAGFGTSTITPEENLGARATWALGEWTVVFWRPLQTGSRYQAQLGGGDATSIAFALWDGANRERGGHKSVSLWQSFGLE